MRGRPIFCLAATIVSIAVVGAREIDGQEKSKKPLIEVKVLVLNFDPFVPKPEGGKARLHEALKWNDPRKLVDGYIADLNQATAGTVRLNVVDWKDVDAFPRKKDGYRYTAGEYLERHREGKGWHDPDAVDYARVVEENDVVESVGKGAADEVWLFGAPYFGYWESAMAGPRSFYVNGGPLPEIRCKRPFQLRARRGGHVALARPSS